MQPVVAHAAAPAPAAPAVTLRDLPTDILFHIVEALLARGRLRRLLRLASASRDVRAVFLAVLARGGRVEITLQNLRGAVALTTGGSTRRTWSPPIHEVVVAANVRPVRAYGGLSGLDLGRILVCPGLRLLILEAPRFPESVQVLASGLSYAAAARTAPVEVRVRLAADATHLFGADEEELYGTGPEESVLLLARFRPGWEDASIIVDAPAVDAGKLRAKIATGVRPGALLAGKAHVTIRGPVGQEAAAVLGGLPGVTVVQE